MSAVTVKRLRKDYTLGKTTVAALRGVDLQVPQGAFIVLSGPSGSGKTTLLNLIGCLDAPTEGEVWIGEKLVSGLPERKLSWFRLHALGFVFQAFNLIPVLDVYENVELPLVARPDIPVRTRRQRVETFIEQVGLKDHVRHRPSELSGGQQQRVAVARALAAGPQIVLADEPTANLDSATASKLIDLMERLNRERGVTFLFSTHDPQVIERARRVVRLRDGGVVADERDV